CACACSAILSSRARSTRAYNLHRPMVANCSKHPTPLIAAPTNVAAAQETNMHATERKQDHALNSDEQADRFNSLYAAWLDVRAKLERTPVNEDLNPRLLNLSEDFATQLGAMPSPQPINVFAKLDVLEWLDAQRAGGADLGPAPRLVLIAGIKADLMG